MGVCAFTDKFNFSKTLNLLQLLINLINATNNNSSINYTLCILIVYYVPSY